jgi:Protein of unknown function (DUF3177)
VLSYLAFRKRANSFLVMPTWISSLVWTDYRLAVVLTVIVPLVLLVGSYVKQNETITRLMVIYWRVASLLIISTYLLIGAIPIGFITGWMARLLIPLSLWYWVDVNDELRDQQESPLKFGLIAWRWSISAYCLIGALLQLPVLRCAFLSGNAVLNPTNEALCYLWLQPPFGFKEMFHPTTKAWFLGGIGLVGLGIYVLYIGYFVFFRLGKHKRSALN